MTSINTEESQHHTVHVRSTAHKHIYASYCACTQHSTQTYICIILCMYAAQHTNIYMHHTVHVRSTAHKHIYASYCACTQHSTQTYIPYRLYITAQKYRFLPCGVTARTKNIYLFWGCGIEKRGFLAYFGACQAKTLCGVGVN